MSDNNDEQHPLREALDTNNPWNNRVFIFFLGWIGGSIATLALWTHFFTI